jgi:hypothetical protein
LYQADYELEIGIFSLLNTTQITYHQCAHDKLLKAI